MDSSDKAIWARGQALCFITWRSTHLLLNKLPASYLVGTAKRTRARLFGSERSEIEQTG